MPRMKLNINYTRTVEISTEIELDIPDDLLSDEDIDVEDALYDYLSEKTELFDGKGTEEDQNEDVELDTVELLD